MRVFKLHKCDIKEYELTKENFKRITQEKNPYVQRFPNKEKHGYAFCPGCGNPIQIIGLYAPIEGGKSPYAKHYGKDIPVKENDSEQKKAFAKKYRVLKTTRYTQISILFLRHERKKIDDDNIEEVMIMTIAHRYNNIDEWIQDSSICIKIDDRYFQNIIHSDKAMMYRNRKLLDIADRLLPVQDIEQHI